MTWPRFYPPGTPPPTAVKTAGTAFRLASTIPPTRDDFRSRFEECPGRPFDSNELWLAVGVSFHLSLEASKQTRDRYKAFRSKHIVTGEFLSTHGKMQQTGEKEKNHLTVWIHIEAQPQERFSEDAEAH